MGRANVKAEKLCIFCKVVKPARAFFRHAYTTRTGKKSTRFMSGCKVCNNANRQARRDAKLTPEQLEANREYVEHRKVRNEQQRKYRASAPLQARNLHLLRTFGITIDEYLARLEQQGGKCAVCGRVPEQSWRFKTLVVDHCHTRGRVRGLLCHSCNVALGLLGENAARVRALAKYVETFELLHVKDHDSGGVG